MLKLSSKRWINPEYVEYVYIQDNGKVFVRFQSGATELLERIEGQTLLDHLKGYVK